MSELFDMLNVNINRGSKRIDQILTHSKKTDIIRYMSEFFIQKKTTSGEFCCKRQKEGKEN